MPGSNSENNDLTIGMPEQPGARHFLAIGEVVDGAYKVMEFIGAGAFGEVYLVRHDILQRDFALKVLKSCGLDDAVRSRFVQEVQVMAKLEHPNIVKIYNSGVYKEHYPYYVMDLITGQPLADLITAGGRIDALSAVTIFVAVADALKVSHSRNIVHRDIKPANIIIADGDGPLDSRVRVVDFGVAKLLGRNSPAYQALTTVGQVFGSPLYMSPEQCTAANIDNRSDVYSLGCALYEALTGVVPFKGPTVMDTFQMHCSQAVPTLKQKAPSQEFAPELEEIIQQLLAKRPEDRFENMTQVKNSLMLIEDRLKKRQEVTAGSAGAVKRTVGVLLLSIFALAGLAFLTSKALEQRDLDKKPTNITVAKSKDSVATDYSLGYYAGVVPENSLLELKQRTKIISADLPDMSDELAKPVTSNQYFRGLDADGSCHYLLPGDKDRLIGKFSILSQQKLLSAPFSGKVTLRKGDKWIFRPDPIVGINPSILLGFRPEDIVGIDLDSLNPSDCPKVLKVAVDRFPELCSVVLRDHQLDAQTLDLINRLPLLRMLAINAEVLTSAQILSLKRLSCLEECEIANYKGDLSELLDRLYSSQLRSLVLQNVCIKESDLFKLSRAHNLQRLALDHVGMKREWLKNLLALNQLAYLDLLNDGENINWVEPLKPFWRLKELVIRDDHASAQERKKLHDLLKRALRVKGRVDNCNVRSNRDTEIGNFGNRDQDAADIGIMLKP